MREKEGERVNDEVLAGAVRDLAVQVKYLGSGGPESMGAIELLAVEIGRLATAFEQIAETVRSWEGGVEMGRS